MSPCTRGGLNECASTALYVGAIANAHSHMPHQIQPSKNVKWTLAGFPSWLCSACGKNIYAQYKRFLYINHININIYWLYRHHQADPNTIAGRLQRSGWLQRKMETSQSLVPWQTSKNEQNGLYWDVHQSNLAIIGTGHWPTCIRLPIPCSVLIVGPRPGNFYDLGKSAEDRAKCPATMPCGLVVVLLVASSCFHHPMHGIAPGQESHDCLKHRPWWARCESKLHGSAEYNWSVT